MGNHASDYVEQGTDIPDSAFHEIVGLVKESQDAEKSLRTLEEEVTSVKNKLKKINEDLIPSAMARINQDILQIPDGPKVTIRRDFTHSLAADRKEQGMDWLEENGHGGIIKREISVTLAKGQEELAKSVITTLQGTYPGIPVESARNVASQTLRSVLKKDMESGVPVPVDIFKVNQFKKAIIE